MEDSELRYADNISWTILNDEVFVFEEITNNIYLLRGLQKDFWIFLETVADIKKVFSLLADKYEMSPRDIEKKMTNKINMYLKNKILERKS